MNPIVHATLGVHIANLGFRQHYGRRAAVILATASVFPDIDSVTVFISREAYAHYHRAFTHSLGGWLVCGALLALLTARQDLKRWLLIDWGLWSLGMVGHTAADIMTRWPIPVLYPLSDVRWSFAIVSWGDEFWTTLLLGFAVAAAIFAGYRRPISGVALGLSFLYLAYRFVVPTPGPSWLSRVWFGFWMR
jgi:membrane-bound metal-dependent hydrolase YbcI (DUF457 family)